MNTGHYFTLILLDLHLSTNETKIEFAELSAQMIVEH